jgi:RNA polymerase sigma factor (sigma-70 family)
MSALLKSLRRTALLGTEDELPDARLLQLFVQSREEAAFEALLRRHGQMVLGVCRRVLGNEPDAEDAFQATFLVLVRKASSLRSGEALASWLYAIAYRTARKAQAMTLKRRNKESLVPPRRPCESADGPWDELVEHLDTELSRLPEKYRAPVVLCELEGKSRKEAARLLHLAEGTLSWRLAHARKLLAERLARYRAALPAGVVAALLSDRSSKAEVPRALAASTAKAAAQPALGQALKAGVVSARVAALTEGVLKTMLLSKLKVVWIVALLVALAGGVGSVGYRSQAQAQRPQEGPVRAEEVNRAPRSLQDEVDELRLEVAALRKGLEATRQRVRELEGTVRGPKRALNMNADGIKTGTEGLPEGDVHRKAGDGSPQPGKDKLHRTNIRHRAIEALGRMNNPLDEAEEALKRLRARPDDQEAAQTLERALQRLRERESRRDQQ